MSAESLLKALGQGSAPHLGNRSVVVDSDVGRLRNRGQLDAESSRCTAPGEASRHSAPPDSAADRGGQTGLDDLVAAKVQEAGAVADLKRLAKRRERAPEGVADWKRRAKVVRYAADIERSKAVHAKLREHEVRASEAESEWARQRTVVAAAGEVLRRASSRLEAVLRERAAVVRQEAFADAQGSLAAAEKNLMRRCRGRPLTSPRRVSHVGRDIFQETHRHRIETEQRLRRSQETRGFVDRG